MNTIMSFGNLKFSIIFILESIFIYSLIEFTSTSIQSTIMNALLPNLMLFSYVVEVRASTLLFTKPESLGFFFIIIIIPLCSFMMRELCLSTDWMEAIFLLKRGLFSMGCKRPKRFMQFMIF